MDIQEERIKRLEAELECAREKKRRMEVEERVNELEERVKELEQRLHAYEPQGRQAAARPQLPAANGPTMEHARNIGAELAAAGPLSKRQRTDAGRAAGGAGAVDRSPNAASGSPPSAAALPPTQPGLPLPARDSPRTPPTAARRHKPGAASGPGPSQAGTAGCTAEGTEQGGGGVAAAPTRAPAEAAAGAAAGADSAPPRTTGQAPGALPSPQPHAHRQAPSGSHAEAAADAAAAAKAGARKAQQRDQRQGWRRLSQAEAGAREASASVSAEGRQTEAAPDGPPERRRASPAAAGQQPGRAGAAAPAPAAAAAAAAAAPAPAGAAADGATRGTDAVELMRLLDAEAAAALEADLPNHTKELHGSNAPVLVRTTLDRPDCRYGLAFCPTGVSFEAEREQARSGKGTRVSVLCYERDASGAGTGGAADEEDGEDEARGRVRRLKPTAFYGLAPASTTYNWAQKLCVFVGGAKELDDSECWVPYKLWLKEHV